MLTKNLISFNRNYQLVEKRITGSSPLTLGQGNTGRTMLADVSAAPARGCPRFTEDSGDPGPKQHGGRNQLARVIVCQAEDATLLKMGLEMS